MKRKLSGSFASAVSLISRLIPILSNSILPTKCSGSRALALYSKNKNSSIIGPPRNPPRARPLVSRNGSMENQPCPAQPRAPNNW